MRRRVTWRRLIRLLRGFAIWYLAGAVIWIPLRALMWAGLGVYMKPSNPNDAALWGTVHLGMYCYLGMRRRYRYMALGALVAVAVNFYALREIGYSGDLVKCFLASMTWFPFFVWLYAWF